MIERINIVAATLFAVLTLNANTSHGYECTVAAIKSRHPEFCSSNSSNPRLDRKGLLDLFDNVQKDMRQLILNNRALSELSEQEKSLLARIESVKPFINNTRCDVRAVDGTAMVNASYSADEHRVHICENLGRLSPLALMSMFSHEIGHSGDSCSCQAHFVTAPNRTRLQLPRDFASRVENASTIRRLWRTPLEPVAMVGKSFSRSPEILENWRNQGWLEFTGSAMTLNEYPLNRIRMCLINRANLWPGRSSDTLARDRTESPGCNNQTDYESMAEVWGALSVGRYLAQHPEIKGAKALELLEGRKQDICSPKTPPKSLESIWLAQPQIAAAIGCEIPAERTCMRENPFELQQSLPAGPKPRSTRGNTKE